MKFRVAYSFLLCILFSTSEIGLAETTRIDNEFFAFRQVSLSAVKDGVTWRPERRALMGFSNGKFLVDFSAVGWVPASCRHVFATALPRKHQGLVQQVAMPPTSTVGKSGQYLSMAGPRCSLSIWLTAPLAADQYAWRRHKGLADVPIPDSPSVIFGLIEARADKERNIIEFVVGARDV